MLEINIVTLLGKVGGDSNYEGPQRGLLDIGSVLFLVLGGGCIRNPFVIIH